MDGAVFLTSGIGGVYALSMHLGVGIMIHWSSSDGLRPPELQVRWGSGLCISANLSSLELQHRTSATLLKPLRVPRARKEGKLEGW